MTTIDLQELSKGIPELTTGVSANLAEAASVCLDSQGHGLSAQMTIDGDYSDVALVNRLLVTDLMQRNHHDERKATENGACGVAILLLRELTSYTVVDQARQGTGFDYWLGFKDADPFDRAARLEVSGILNGTATELSNRISRKKNQTRRSNEQLPAFIIVVEFGTPISSIVQRKVSP
jgi:hypothetical protein